MMGPRAMAALMTPTKVPLLPLREDEELAIPADPVRNLTQTEAREVLLAMPVLRNRSRSTPPRTFQLQEI